MKEEKKFLANKIGANELCVLALSGGPDSMCLFHLLLEMNVSFVCVHINHGTREENEREYLFVREYVQKFGIPLEYFKIDSYRKNKFSEEEARKIRYAKFLEVAHKYHAKYLLTAHHGDDLTETIFMRLLRGSTLEGYSGIKRVSSWNDIILLRPLLTKKKKDIYQYLTDNNIPYVEDESNQCDDYLRNRIRHNLLPILERENKNYHLKMLQFSELLQEKAELILDEVNKTRDEIEKNGKILVPKFLELSYPMQRAYIESYLKEVYQEELDVLTRNHVELFARLICGKKDISYYDFPRNYLFIKADGWCYLKKKEVHKPFLIEVQDYNLLPNGDEVLKVNSYEHHDNYAIRLNSQNLTFPLYLTTRKNGMRMEVKNLNGSKKVNDIFIDEKILSVERDSIPILVDSNGTVLWILGLKKSKYDIEKNESYDIIYKYIKRKEK